MFSRIFEGEHRATKHPHLQEARLEHAFKGGNAVNTSADDVLKTREQVSDHRALGSTRAIAIQGKGHNCLRVVMDELALNESDPERLPTCVEDDAAGNDEDVVD